MRPPRFMERHTYQCSMGRNDINISLTKQPLRRKEVVLISVLIVIILIAIATIYMPVPRNSDSYVRFARARSSASRLIREHRVDQGVWPSLKSDIEAIVKRAAPKEGQLAIVKLQSTEASAVYEVSYSVSGQRQAAQLHLSVPKGFGE